MAVFYYKFVLLATGKKQIPAESQKIHKGNLAFFEKKAMIVRMNIFCHTKLERKRRI